MYQLISTAVLSPTTVEPAVCLTPFVQSDGDSNIRPLPVRRGCSWAFSKLWEFRDAERPSNRHAKLYGTPNHHFAPFGGKWKLLEVSVGREDTA